MRELCTLNEYDGDVSWQPSVFFPVLRKRYGRAGTVRPGRTALWCIIVAAISGAAVAQGAGLCQTCSVRTDQDLAFTATCGGGSVTVTNAAGAVVAEIPVACCTSGAIGTDHSRVYVISDEFSYSYVTSIDIATLKASQPPALLVGVPANQCPGDVNRDA
jgi:hypothetical protein